MSASYVTLVCIVVLCRIQALSVPVCGMGYGAKNRFNRTHGTDEENSICGEFVVQSPTLNITHSKFHVTFKNAVKDRNLLWKNAVIPYVIDGSYSSSEREVIAGAMAQFHFHTCIRFVPRTTHQDYIRITKYYGCSSAVGKTGGPQVVSLGTGCVYKGTAMHELMHSTGFWHEQSRADRDEHVRIIWNNIKEGLAYNFIKFNWTDIQSLGSNYDTDSILHYGRTAFAKDTSLPTIIPFNNRPIGQRDGFSRTDIHKLNTLYNCNNPVIVSPETHCKDTNKYCTYWANKGECEKNPSWMKVNCVKSCLGCKTSQCRDKNVHCGTWANTGFCRTNAKYMSQNCRHSCGQCHWPVNDYHLPLSKFMKDQ